MAERRSPLRKRLIILIILTLLYVLLYHTKWITNVNLALLAVPGYQKSTRDQQLLTKDQETNHTFVEILRKHERENPNANTNYCTKISQHRMETARHVCMVNNIMPSNKPRKLDGFIVSNKYKFMFELTPKVSSTTWRHLLHDVVDPQCMGNMYGYRMLNTTLNKTIEEYKKAIFFREPLERLVSYYYGMMHYKSGQSVNNKKFDDLIIRSGIRNHSVMHTKPKGDIYNITFSEFAQMVLFYKANASIPSSSHYQRVGYKLCLHDYDFVGHFETLAEDAECFLELINIADQYSFPEIHIQRGNVRFSESMKSLPQNILRDLIEFYRLDYEILGYKIPKF
ncbi:carbohydrate sulfotransferase 11-like [Saccoglossus kowalevskii]|uniref:Carbohydrate sulfotransferase n=1 Tax=Saccoglossus kowalevskii TaxID=10224 RepID=A0ABM0MJA2_SACKO|nr:PREDICTED: carbohydrate sulfotransferase 11-like [Saccoglossus kowalevskii]